MWHALGNRRVPYWVSVRKPEGKEKTGRPSRRFGNNIKIDLKEIV